MFFPFATAAGNGPDVNQMVFKSGKKKRKERKLSKEKKKETRTFLFLVKWINNFFPSLCVFFFFFFSSENVGTQNKISTFVDSWDSFPLRYTGRIVFIMHRQTVTYYFPILLLLWNLHFLILFPSLLRYVLLRRVGRLSVFLFFQVFISEEFSKKKIKKMSVQCAI